MGMLYFKICFRQVLELDCKFSLKIFLIDQDNIQSNLSDFQVVVEYQFHQVYVLTNRNNKRQHQVRYLSLGNV